MMMGFILDLSRLPDPKIIKPVLAVFPDCLRYEVCVGLQGRPFGFRKVSKRWTLSGDMALP
jgi:hypothetical protein